MHFKWSNDKVTGLLLQSTFVIELLDLKDNKDCRAFDIPITHKVYLSIVKLLSKMKEPEGYFSKMNKEQLLRSINIISVLFKRGTRLPAGDYDEDGRTVLLPFMMLSIVLLISLLSKQI